MEIKQKWPKYASAGTRTRVQALATPGDNHYTTLACTLRILQGFKRLSARLVESQARDGILNSESASGSDVVADSCKLRFWSYSSDLLRTKPVNTTFAIILTSPHQSNHDPCRNEDNQAKNAQQRGAKAALGRGCLWFNEGDGR